MSTTTDAAPWRMRRVAVSEPFRLASPVAFPDVTDHDLRLALEEANVPVLLALLTQLGVETTSLTGGARVSNNDVPGVRQLTKAAQEAVRGRAFEVLNEIRTSARALPDSLTARGLAEAARVCLGTELDSEFLPMLAEDMGFTDTALSRVRWSAGAASREAMDFHVVIIGAGLSGLCMAIHLQRLGIPYVVLEKNAGLGGTWFENTYPDCGVDTPNHFYCYSFAPNDEWSARYSKRDEILAYLRETARRFGVTPHIELNTEVVAADYDADGQAWLVHTRARDGRQGVRRCNVLVSGVGQVNRPMTPEIPGADTFSGETFHSSAWPADFDPAGKRVAVVGTGASAMQFAPAIADRVKSLVIFQRTPHWIRILPEYHERVSAGEQWLLRHVPFYRNWYRTRLYWSYGDTLLDTLRVDPRWPDTSRSINAANDRIRRAYEANLRNALGGRQDLLAKVIPDHPVFAKRMLIDNHWCRMLQRDNVELVTSGVRHIVGNAVEDADAVRREVDVIVYATGFKALRFLWPIRVTGRAGRTLEEVWGDDARAYLGMVTPDFPNLFLLYGPNTNLAHGGSIYFHAECQARYIAQCLVGMIERGHGAMEVTDAAHRRYCAAVDAEHAGLIWANACVGEWFKNDAGRVVCVSPWRLVDYWHMTHTPNWADFRLEPNSRANRLRAKSVGGEDS